MTNVVILTKEEYREMNHIPKLRVNIKSKPEVQISNEVIPPPNSTFIKKVGHNSHNFLEIKNLRNSLSPITHHESINENNETLRAIEMLDREKLDIQMSPEMNARTKPGSSRAGLYERRNSNLSSVGLKKEDLEGEKEMLENAKRAYEEEISKIIDLRSNLERNLAQQTAKRGNKTNEELEEDGIWKQRYEDVWRSRKMLEVEVSQLKNNLDYFERQIKIIVDEKNGLAENHSYKIDQMINHNQGLIQAVNELERRLESEKENFSEQLKERDGLLFQKNQELQKLTQEYTSLIKEVNEERQKDLKLREMNEEHKDLRHQMDSMLRQNSELENLVVQKGEQLASKEEYIRHLSEQLEYALNSNKETESQILELNEKVRLLVTENERVLQIIREQESDSNSKDERIHFLNMKIESLEGIKIEMERDISKVLSTVNNERRIFESQISALKMNISELDRELELCQESQNILKTKFNEQELLGNRNLEVNLAEMENEIFRLNAEVDRLNSLLQNHQYQSFGVPRNFDDRIERTLISPEFSAAGDRDFQILKEENLNLKITLDRKSKELDLWIEKFKNESRNHDLNDFLADYEIARKNAIEKQVEAIKSQLQTEKFRLEAALSEQLKKQDDSEKKLNAMMKENLKLVEEIKEKNINYEELYNQFRDLANKLASAKKERDELRVMYEALQTSYQTSSDQKENSMKNMESKLKILKEKKKTYKKANRDLLKNMEKLREEILNQRDNMGGFVVHENNKELQIMNEELKHAREEIEHLNNIIKVREKEINAQNQMIENLKAELELGENDKRRIRDDYNNLLNQIKNGGDKTANGKSESMMLKKTDWSGSENMYENHYETSQFQMSMKKEDRFKRLQDIESRRINQHENNNQKEFLKVIPEIVVTHSRPLHLAELQTASSQPFYIKDSLSYLK